MGESEQEARLAGFKDELFTPQTHEEMMEESAMVLLFLFFGMCFVAIAGVIAWHWR